MNEEEDGQYNPEDLPEEARRKLEQEFQSIALPYINSLYNVALSLTHNEKDAEDLVQETYLRAFRFFHQFKRGTNCKAWLFRILRNTHINRFRKQAKEPQIVDLEDLDNQAAEEDLSQQPLSPREELFKELYDDEIQAALDGLPEDFRTVIILSDIEGLSYQEIADVIGCPMGTVRSRLSRGRRLLERKLRQYAKEHGFIREK